MKKTVLAVCDSDKRYVERLQEYLRNNLKLSFEIISFTESSKLKEYSNDSAVSLLIITDREFEKEGRAFFEEAVRNIIVLKDDEVIPEKVKDDVRYVSRLCPASEIVKQVIGICTERAEDFIGLTADKQAVKRKVIGLFTPISGCGQTSLALSLGEKISKKGRSILISFESFSKLRALREGDSDEDLTDLLYFAECSPDSFGLYLERMLIRKGDLDIVPPPVTAAQLKEIKAENVRNLLELLCEKGGYEYILLDIKEYPERFADILSMCDIVYTIIGESAEDQQKIAMYNQFLIENDYDLILERTVKCSPLVKKIPQAKKQSINALIDRGREVLELGT